MNDSGNNITIYYENSPALREAFSRKKNGDTCEFTLKIQANDIGKSKMEGRIKVITLEEHDEDGKEKEVKPSTDEPAVVEMKMGDESLKLEPSAY